MENDEEKLSEIMNLIGYGLAKFSLDFVREFGFSRYADFYRYIVELRLAKTVKAVTNRQDSFDPYFDNGRKGWHQRNQREHIKLFIDSLFGNEDAKSFANIVKLYIQSYDSKILLTSERASPAMQSKFKQLQATGKEAEFYFMNNFDSIDFFRGGILEDARLWGDGYDFQIEQNGIFLLAEVKGVKQKSGFIRMTQNEYDKATEFKANYFLVVVSNLISTPHLTLIQNPLEILKLEKHEIKSIQANYHSQSINWEKML